MNLYYTNRRFIEPRSLLALFKRVSGGYRNSKGQLQYHAYCPAHETHHQSLAIAFEPNGLPLIHCHAGCSKVDVLAAVGLKMSDLFPDGALAHKIDPVTPPHNVQVHKTVLEIAKADREAGKRLSKADRKREREAWLALKKEQVWPPQECHR